VVLLSFSSRLTNCGGANLPDARRIVEEWRMDYNRSWPHSSLGNLSAEEFQRTFTEQMVPAGLS
jgi:transposase InsO family protein